MGMFQINENVEVPFGIVVADGFDKAVVGYTTTSDGFEHVIYDYDNCVHILMDKNNWEYEEAAEWVDFNVVGAYVGEQTPLWMFK